MNRSFLTQIFLIIFVGVIATSALTNTYAENGYTTTVTEYLTSVMTSIRTETVDTTITDSITRTETRETYTETQQEILTRTTVMLPTPQVIEFETCVWDTDELGRTVAGGCHLEERTVIQLTPVIVNSPTTIVSLITSPVTLTETIEVTRIDRVPQTKTELLTFTFENIYTSVSSPPTPPPSEFDTGLAHNYLLYGIIIALIAIVATLAIKGRSRGSGVKYCISCGSTIPAKQKFCPKCGQKQD